MEFLTKLEHTVIGWFKEAPHLPHTARKWLGENAWWIVAVFAVASAVGVLGKLVALLSNLSTLSSPFVAYYASSTFITWAIVKTAVALVFNIAICSMLIMAVSPLKEKQKKGWVLVFASILLSAVAVVVNAIITLNALSFMTEIIFGGLVLGVAAYFSFEVHSQFAHVEKSKGAKKER